MKRIILLCSLIALALSAQSQNFTTGTWNKVNAKDTLVLSGRALAEVVYSVLVTSKNNEVPSAKSVWDLVQSQIGDKISGTGEAPRVAYFTNNDEIGGDPDLQFDDADNILNVQDIILDGSNNEVTAGGFNGEYFGMSGLNAAGYVVSTATSGSSSGAYLALRSNDNSPMASGDRLGAITFGGATTGPGSSNEGIKLEAFAEGAYSGSSQPTGLRISTIPTSSNTPVERLWLSQNGDLSILGGKENRWWDTDGSNYVGFKAPSLSSNYTYTLPTDFGTTGYQLTTDGSGTLSWTAQSGAVSQPNLQIVSGTGSSITSSADFTHDITNNRIFAQDTFMTYKPAFINVPSAWRSRMLGRPDMGIVAQHTQADPSALTQMSLAYYTLGVGASTSSSAATACPSIRFYKAKVSAGNVIAGTAGESLAFFGFQNHKGDVTHFNDFYNHTNGGYIFNAIIDSVAADGSVSSRTDFYAKPITGTGAAPVGTRFLSGRGSGDIYLPAYSPSRNDAGTPAVILSVDASNRVTAHPVSELPGGATDHGALTGLSDDDHTQYFLLAGRSGGQVGTGGTGAGDDLTLRSTTNATKGDVILNDQGGNVILGGGELSGELRFMEPAGSGANYTGFKSGAMGGDQMYTLPIDAPANGEVLTWNTGGGLSWDAVDTNPNDDAPNDVSYITMANTASLSNERALSWGVNNVRVDGGPNSSVNLDVLSGVSVVSQFTSDQDNYTNSDWSTRTTHTVSSDNGMRAMTGFVALAEGTIRRLINTGTYAMYLPSEHPDSDAANRVGGTGDHILAPNKGVIEMTYIGSRWEVTYNSFNEAALGFKYKGQFYNQVPGSTNQSDQPFIGLTTAGTGAGNQNNPPDDSPNLPQSWGLLTGTTATGSQTVYFPKNNNAFAAFGGGHLAAFGQIYVPALSTSGQRFTAQISLTPSANGSTLAVNSSVGIRYSDNINGGEWEVFTRNSGGSETTGDSNIAVAANTVYTCAIYVDKSLTEARFFITDGTNNYVTRIAATMPASTALAGVRVIGIASVGTTSKQVAVANIGGYIIQP